MTAKVSLRLMHSTMDLAPIAGEIGLPVKRIWKAGENRQTPKGQPLEGIYQHSYCALDVITEAEDIPTAIAVVDAALHRAANVCPLLRGLELEKALYCTLLVPGEVIDCDSLARLVKWGIRLELDGGSDKGA